MGRSIRALIVASTERLRHATRDRLAGVPGFEIVALGSCEEARDLALRHHPDIVVFAVEPAEAHELSVLQEIEGASAGAAIEAASDDAGGGAAPASGPLSTLTPREREVLRMAAEGLSSAETGRQLGISVRTAECHRAHGMRKLGLHRRADLVRFAMASGLVGGRTDLR